MKITKALKKQITKSIHDAVVQFLLDKLAGKQTVDEPQDYVWESLTRESWYKDLEASTAEGIEVLRENVGAMINDEIFKQVEAHSNLLKSFLK